MARQSLFLKYKNFFHLVARTFDYLKYKKLFLDLESSTSWNIKKVFRLDLQVDFLFVFVFRVDLIFGIGLKSASRNPICNYKNRIGNSIVQVLWRAILQNPCGMTFVVECIFENNCRNEWTLYFQLYWKGASYKFSYKYIRILSGFLERSN